MKKRILSVFLATLIIFTALSVTASARMNYTDYWYSDLMMSGNTAECYTGVYGYYGITSMISINQVLERSSNGTSFSTYAAFGTFSSNNYYFDLTNFKSGLPSGYYRIKNIANVYSGSSYETLSTFYSNVVKVS